MREMLVLRNDGSYEDSDDPGEQCYGGGTKRVSVTDAEAAILQCLARDCRVLEIGTGLAVATRAISESAAHVTTVDTDPWVHEWIFPQLELLGNVFCVDSTSLICGAYDLAFIDGCHNSGEVSFDFALCKKLVRSGGLIVLHDFTAAHIRDLPECRDAIEIKTTHGLGLIFV
jgi:Predicted O-methyltransferase